MVSQTAAAASSSLGEEITPAAEAVAAAESERCRSIAYTYIEPRSLFEYIFDRARLARAG